MMMSRILKTWGAAKLQVDLVAALSSNMAQVGSVTMMALLLTSTALVALSNAIEAAESRPGAIQQDNPAQ
ncbi:hypothetical protein VTH06DRAFT_4404 [Thermothelomyces fergusii]